MQGALGGGHSALWSDIWLRVTTDCTNCFELISRQILGVGGTYDQNLRLIKMSLLTYSFHWKFRHLIEIRQIFFEHIRHALQAAKISM